MSDLRARIADVLVNYYDGPGDDGTCRENCLHDLTRVVAEELAEVRAELERVTTQRDNATRDFQGGHELSKALDKASREVTDLRRELSDAVKERDEARRAYQCLTENIPATPGGALAGWDGSPTMPGGSPTTADTVAERLAEARQALDADEWDGDAAAIRAIIAAVGALAGHEVIR